METFSALLALCAENSPVTTEFPAQRLVTWILMFSLNKRLSKTFGEAGDLRRQCVHYYVIVMLYGSIFCHIVSNFTDKRRSECFCKIGLAQNKEHSATFPGKLFPAWLDCFTFLKAYMGAAEVCSIAVLFSTCYYHFMIYRFDFILVSCRYCHFFYCRQRKINVILAICPRRPLLLIIVLGRPLISTQWDTAWLIECVCNQVFAHWINWWPKVPALEYIIPTL